MLNRASSRLGCLLLGTIPLQSKSLSCPLKLSYPLKESLAVAYYNKLSVNDHFLHNCGTPSL